MAEVVPAYVWQPGAAEEGLEVAVNDILSIEGGALDRGEHETVILPFLTSLELLRQVPFALVPEGF